MEAISGLRKTIESVVFLVSAENSSSPPRINIRQCELLAKKASGVLHVLEEFQNVLSSQELVQDGSKLPHDWTPGVLELHRVLKDAEILIRDCCCDGQWLEFAIKRGNLKETFAKLLYDMEWHTSVLCSVPLVTKSDGFDRSACEGKLGVTEDFMLSSAALHDRKFLRELLTGFQETSKPDSAVEKQSSLAMKLLAKLDAEEEELDRSAILSNSQSPLFLWVPSTDLKKGRLIGRGGYAEVKEATWLGQRYAIKILTGGTALRVLFKQEIAAMAGLDHPHIVRVVSCSEDNRNLGIVMELMYKSLFDLLEDYKSGTHAAGATTPFPIIQAVDLMLQIAEGVRYLHSKNLAHRDLKSLNILVQFADPQAIQDSFDTVHFTDGTVNPFTAKIADFGLTKIKHASTAHHTLNVGTRAWMAPELFKFEDVELLGPSSRFRPMKMDAYSFGMVCYEILTGETPFDDIVPPRLPVLEFQKLVKGGRRPTLPKDIPSMLAVTIERCWDGNSRRRPDFSTICTELRYIKGLLLQGMSVPFKLKSF
jgi:serine/threonine protein kinase